MIHPALTLCWRDEPDSAIPVLVVIPVLKIPHPAPNGVQAGETCFRPDAQTASHQIERARVNRSGDLDDRLHSGKCNRGLFWCWEKRGPEEPQDHALGRSRGGLTTKIHMLCDANGVPLRFLLSGGQASDIAYAQPLLDEAYIPSLRGRPRKRCRWLLADKGYDAEALRRYCDRYRMQPVIPLRSMKRKPKPGLPRLFDRPKYRQSNIIERMFGWLKENRRIVTRVDKLAKSYEAMASLACAMRCLRRYFSYRA
ncbi:Transposase [Pseudomonas marginalis]|nr:Transposase [Pseudomonas marginalis]